MTSRRAPSRRVQEFPMTAENLLAEAAAVVRDRRHPYGQPLDLFERVAARWSQVLGVTVTASQIAICLIDLKVARLTHDPRPTTHDTWTASLTSLAMPAAWPRCCLMPELRGCREHSR
jgi:Domain of unknown function (DUF6378)